jgi:hypothetical protein
MRRIVVTVAGLLAAAAIAAPAAQAGSPHFINNAFSISRTGDTLTVNGKEAGLGDEAQIHVVLTATAACINRGGNHPQAANKTTVSAEGDFPVQNGKAVFTLSATATFQPECSPPMSVVFSDVMVTDETNGLTRSFGGTY